VVLAFDVMKRARTARCACTTAYLAMFRRSLHVMFLIYEYLERPLSRRTGNNGPGGKLIRSAVVVWREDPV
jgi:hypothetical protein